MNDTPSTHPYTFLSLNSRSTVSTSPHVILSNSTSRSSY